MGHPSLREVHRQAAAADSERAWSRVVSADIRRRVDVVSRLDASERTRNVARLTIADPVNGLETFIRDFVWTYDPRNTSPLPKDLPLVPWQKQIEFLRWLQRIEDTGDDGVVDKSRDVGVTWLVVAYYVWRWLTVPGWAGAIGSRKADLLDRLNDPKSIFWKVEYVIRMMPTWLRPAGFLMPKHRSYARIINPATNATITGEAGPEMGRGGRSSFYFLDEFGVMPRASQVRAAVADNARSVLYASTATGPDTEFYRIVHEDGIPHFRLSWQHDPRKSPEWRSEYVRKYGPATTAREVDIDYGNDAMSVFGSVQLEPMSQGQPYIWGWDLARSVDWVVGVALDRAGKICRIERWQRPWVESIEDILRVTGRTRAIGDATGPGAAPVEILQRLGCPIEAFVFSNPSKTNIVEALAYAVRNGHLKIPEGPIQQEMARFSMRMSPSGKTLYAAPSGYHDDCIMALAMAWHLGTSLGICGRDGVVAKAISSSSSSTARVSTHGRGAAQGY